MPAYFEKRLVELLPPLYREKDESGDLRAFLAVPAASLDELKALADGFPDIFDVDRCEARFLPLLGRIVGHKFDPRADVSRQRRLIREAVEIYRRKGTVPAMERSLADLGWQGRIEETFRKALRLNQRARIGKSRLAGQVYSLGVYRIESDEVMPGIGEAVAFHHPAGTRVFFLQRLKAVLCLDTDLEAFVEAFVRRSCVGRLHEAFTLNHNVLNAGNRLTRRIKTWTWLQFTKAFEAVHETERAAVCFSSWLSRPANRMRMNLAALNQRRLPNIDTRERCFSLCCEVAVKPTIPIPFLRLSRNRLNRVRLNRAAPACRYRFRQKDLFSVASHDQATPMGERQTLSWIDRSFPAGRFRVGFSRLGQRDKVAGNPVVHHLFTVT